MDDPLADVVIPPYPCPPARNTLLAWYAEAEELDHLRLERAPQMVAAWWEDAPTPERRERTIELLRAGETFDTIAQMAGVTAEEVARPFSRSGTDVDGVPRALRVHRLWAADKDRSMRSIAAEIGCHPSDVRGLLEALGARSKPAARLREGGGTKFSHEFYEELRRLREEKGYSWSRIGKQLGVHDGTAAKMYHRRFKAKVVAS